MATQPKPKPKPSPEPPEPEPGPEDEPNPDVNDADNLRERFDALFASQVALIERVDKLEERMNAPPVGLGKRP